MKKKDNVILIRLPGESDARYESRMLAKAEQLKMDPPVKHEMLIIQYSERNMANVKDPDDDGGPWVSIHPEDTPDWVKTPDALAEMREGTRICADPEGGSRWYRVVRPKNVQGPRAVPDEGFPEPKAEDAIQVESTAGEVEELEEMQEETGIHLIGVTAPSVNIELDEDSDDYDL